MNIYITLDYELYLGGRTGTVENCLIIPTHRLLELLAKHSVKATFFVDAAYLYRLQELKGNYSSLEEDYCQVSEQIETIVKKGHAIGLHIHPQWFYSTYDGKKWVMDFAHYKLSDMPQNDADRYFEACYKLLRDISGYNISSFRAGGYSIQAYDDFALMMRKCGLKNDSSVLFRMKNYSKLHYFDYSHVKDTDSYVFSNDLTEEDPKGEYCEYPITTERVSYFRYCYLRYKYGRKADNKNWGDGGISVDMKSHSFIKNMIRKTKWFIYVSATLDYQSFFFFDIVFRSLKRRKKGDFVVIGHPKNFSLASLEMIDTFIKANRDCVYKTL